MTASTPTTDSKEERHPVIASPDTSVVIVESKITDGSTHTTKSVREDVVLSLDESVIDESVAIEAHASNGETTTFTRFKFEDPSVLIEYLEHTLARLDQHQQYSARTR